MIKNTRSASNKKHLIHFSACHVIFLLPLLIISVSAIFTGATWNIFHSPEHTALNHSSADQKSYQTLMTVTQQFANAPASKSIYLLSSTLSSYLSTLGPNVGVDVYDATHQSFYTSNSSAQFLTASSIKVPIMLAFFSMTENQGREPNSYEMDLLTAMIEHSDNDAASALYYDINGATGLANYLQRIGVTGLVPDNNAWGYSLITPQAMVNLLMHLQNGTLLSANDRAIALYLMQHIEVDQQWGVGDTAPQGATVSMKNGWVPGPDGLWSVNTSGIVNRDGETYIISVYTQEQQSLADGQAIVQQVCGTVASSLI